MNYFNRITLIIILSLPIFSVAGEPSAPQTPPNFLILQESPKVLSPFDFKVDQVLYNRLIGSSLSNRVSYFLFTKSAKALAWSALLYKSPKLLSYIPKLNNSIAAPYILQYVPTLGKGLAGLAALGILSAAALQGSKYLYNRYTKMPTAFDDLLITTFGSN
jgi:hypothetical protein